MLLRSPLLTRLRNMLTPGLVRHAQSKKMIDHAGTPCSSFDPSAISLVKNSGSGGMTQSEYRDFIRLARRRDAGAALSMIFGWLLLLMAVFFFVSFVDRLIQGGLEWKDIVRAGFWLYLVVLGIYAVTSPGLSHDTMVRELLADGRCACCAFNLRDLPLCEKQLSRCPECGTQWYITQPRTNA